MNTDRPLSLDELGRLVQEVAGEQCVDARVVGVIPTQGNGNDAEVVMTRGDERSALSFGVRRDDGVAGLRREIAVRLNAE